MSSSPKASSLGQNHEHRVDDVRSLAQRSLDRLIAPASRRRAYDSESSLAAARLIFFSFAVSQLVFSFLPLLLFAAFAVSTVFFAFGVALLFALFGIGAALFLLVPALLVASSIAVLVWGWALGSFLVARWLYTHAPFAAEGRMHVEAAGRHVDLVKNENGVNGKFSGKH